MKAYTYLIASVLLLASCGEKKDKAETTDELRATENLATENYVDTMTLRLTDFQSQIVCNGKTRGTGTADLTPRHTDIYTAICVRNGQRVEKGQLLAVTDETLCRRELERAERELEKARVDFADKLITMGYEADDSSVPAEIRKRAEVTSGYYSARYALETARINLADCRVTAPIAGVVANLEGRLHQRPDKALCSIIDDSSFDVDFSILEAELAAVAKGQEVIVSPFVDDSLQVRGTITEVNPTVNEKGLVKVTARVPGRKGNLIDGMNVKVVCQQRVPQMFVVPKDAVVERDGYHVVFLLDNGRAHWTYVDILHSNLTHHAITGCQRKETQLHEGDIVITSGNLNLADDTEVRIR